MSREVRRVPMGWKHPVTHNEQFVPLFEGPLSKRQAAWDAEKAEWDAGTHSGFAFLLNYHSPDGYLNADGTRDAPVPYSIYAADGETVERKVFLTSVAEVQEHYPFEERKGSRPEADSYMPDFDVSDDELGWCLYETVSEGTPVTPVFATAEELVEHLYTVGQDWAQPMRRESAEQIVRTGSTMGSMVSVGGTVYRSDVDADKIAALTAPASSPSPREAAHE